MFPQLRAERVTRGIGNNIYLTFQLLARTTIFILFFHEIKSQLWGLK